MSNRVSPSVKRLQNRLSALIGEGAPGRTPIVEQMLARDAKEAIAYWLQLGVSVGIATLGLVLGSTAVVIAAMLVAPLMGPIIGLGMGLATGGPFLTLRAAVRVAASVAVVIGGSAVVTLTLPFHEMNAELAARTVPTALDLITAAFCALAGVYATARATSDTATTAAGTSIGISLVPPLCTAGFCFGTGQWALGLGASLLFLTNMVAIVVVGTLSFVALGFNQVPIAAIEAEHLARGTQAPVVSIVARVLANIYAWRWGSWLRLLMPVALLGVVYVPLRTALDEVTWQVKVRGAAKRLFDELEANVVASRLRIERHQVDAMLVIIGNRADAEALRVQLLGELTRISGVSPNLEVRAVADASAAAIVDRITALEPVVPTAAPEPFSTRAAEVHDELVEALAAQWPATSVGDPLAVDVEATATDLALRVTHVGAPLDDAAREVLERSLGNDLDVMVTLVDESLPSAPIEDLDRPSAIGTLAVLLERSRRFRSVRVCVLEPRRVGPVVDAVGPDSIGPGSPDSDAGSAAAPAPTEPEPVPEPEPEPADSPQITAVRSLLAAHPRVTIVPDDHWALWFTTAECPTIDAPP